MRELLEQRVNPPEPCEPYNLRHLEELDDLLRNTLRGVVSDSTLDDLCERAYALEATYEAPEEEYEYE